MHGANWKPTRRIAHGSFEAWMRFWYQWIQRRKRKRRPDDWEADAEDDADNREREERETENSFLRANVKARRKTKTTMFSQQQ